MKKQELARKIWNSANKMRGSRIEASEYKDYVLGFIFYKFLSDKEVAFVKKKGMTCEAMPEQLREEKSGSVTFCQGALGYFISYENLFSTWIADGSDFNVSRVQTALSAFRRNISMGHKKLFDGIFDTLETGLSNLGQNTGEQTRNIRALLELLNSVPTDNRQGYDVLGYIYEYLVGNFAANAGKKAGEFYTPHEVSELMSEIIAHYLQGRETIKIYDPTSGSGSLLITIGKSVGKYAYKRDSIKYYAQEVKPNTHNLTRMNLIMRGIAPDNIDTRCGNTLDNDWPWFDESDPIQTYDPLYVDAVVSNPPYSLQWNPTDKEVDPRFKYGLAPRGAADYAFLLHSLYHLCPDGIMAIVLPHGVLFRGDAEGNGEGQIRKNLIENNHIDTIIGLPANIFYGTGIPTIIMVLKKNRPDTDVLFVDASQGFVKEGNNNRLQACHIRRIADAVVNRESIPDFSRRVSKDEIRANGYNLNIPRYVSATREEEHWDIYAAVCGGIPNEEINQLSAYWEQFPRLRDQLFHGNDTPYSCLAEDTVNTVIGNSEEVKRFLQRYRERFQGMDDFFHDELIDGMGTLSLAKEEERLWQDINRRMDGSALIDKYEAYQALDDAWQGIAPDLELLQTEGWGVVRQVEEHMVISKSKGEDVEKQDGWEGRILPFALVQKHLLPEALEEINQLKDKLSVITENYKEIIESLPEEESAVYLNDDNTAFVPKVVKSAVNGFRGGIATPELRALAGYVAQFGKRGKKADKIAYIDAHPEVSWDKVEGSVPYTAGKVNARIKAIRAAWTFPEDSLESKLSRVLQLQEEEKGTANTLKRKKRELEEKTMETIRNLSDEDAKMLLQEKWIRPLYEELASLDESIPDTLARRVTALADKYGESMQAITEKEEEAARALTAMMDELEGSEFEMKGLTELRALLGGK